MKLLHNFVSLGAVTLVAEAAACAHDHGVAPEVFVDVLAKGGGGGIALERLKPFLLNEDLSGLRFSIANAVKDLSYYGAMAQDAGSARDVAGAVLQTLQTAAAQADPTALMPEVARLLRRRDATESKS
jgi:3-hydroxyisobutyrate dehydrogenase-like beta-hydroxyacid dehydrogenase